MIQDLVELGAALVKRFFLEKESEKEECKKFPDMFPDEVVLGLMRAVDALFEDVDYEKMAEFINEKLEKEYNSKKKVTSKEVKKAVWAFKKLAYEHLLKRELPEDIFPELVLRPKEKSLEVSIGIHELRVKVLLDTWEAKILEPQLPESPSDPSNHKLKSEQ